MNERIMGKEKKPLPQEQVQSPQFSLVKKKQSGGNQPLHPQCKIRDCHMIKLMLTSDRIGLVEIACAFSPNIAT